MKVPCGSPTCSNSSAEVWLHGFSKSHQDAIIGDTFAKDQLILAAE